MIDLFDLLGYVLLLSIVGPATLLVLLKLQGKKMPSLLGRSTKKIEGQPAEDDDLALPSERRRGRDRARSRDRGRSTREREPAEPAGPAEEVPTERVPPPAEPVAMPRRGAPIVEAPEPAPEGATSPPEPRPVPRTPSGESPAEAPREIHAPEEGRAAAISERLANMTPEERLRRREERRARRASRSD